MRLSLTFEDFGKSHHEQTTHVANRNGCKLEGFLTNMENGVCAFNSTKLST